MRFHEAWDLMVGGTKMVVPGLLEMCRTDDAYFSVQGDCLIVHDGSKSVRCKDIPVHIALSNRWTEKVERVYVETSKNSWEEFLKWKAEREAKK